jgi:hypothetical protein
VIHKVSRGDASHVLKSLDIKASICIKEGLELTINWMKSEIETK